MAQQLSAKTSEGVSVGQSAADKVGFYGVAPIAQPAVLAAVTTTAATQGATAAYGFTTTAQFNALIAAVNTLIADQKLLGLRATA